MKGADFPTLDNWIQTQTIWTVSQVNARIKELIEDSGGLQDIWVKGEVSSLKRSSAGHYYFNLLEKDAGTSSMIQCVIWSSIARNIRFDLRDGDVTEILGSINVYSPGGRYSLQVANTQKTGEGERFILLERWRKELCEAGYFSPERKRGLPRYPTRIGVVTSDTGAVIHDITNVIRNRFPVEILLAHTPVQGDAAHLAIARAVGRVASQNVDLIIIARGGGSAEDLFPFNRPEVVRAVVQSPVPVISAVGHEVDITFCDLAADIRASTPSHAAELAVPDARAEFQKIRDQKDRIGIFMRSLLERMYEEVSHHKDRFSRRKLLSRVIDGREYHGELANRMDKALINRIRSDKRQVENIRAAISAANPVMRLTRELHNREEQIGHFRQRILQGTDSALKARRYALSEIKSFVGAKNPLDLMKSGYSLVFLGESVVTTSRGIQRGDIITVRWADGTAEATIREVRNHENV